MIEVAEPETFRAVAADGHRGPLLLMTALRYRYRYQNVDYVGLHSSIGRTVPSNSRWLARCFQRDYAAGEAVQVSVNPDNPSIAAIDPKASGLWLLWLAAALFGTGAVYLASSG